MRSRVIVSVLVALFLLAYTTVQFAMAQVTIVECGSIVAAEFTQNDQIQAFEIRLNARDQVTLSVAGESDQVKVGIWLYSPSDVLIGGNNGGSSTIPKISTPSFRSGVLSTSGIYTIRVQNGTYDPTYSSVHVDGQNDSIGSYQVFVDCTLADGTRIPAGTPVASTPAPPLDNITVTLPIIRSQSITPLQCGQIISSEFTDFAELQRFSVDIASDDQAFWVTVTPVGDYLRTSMAVFDPTGTLIGDQTGLVRASPSVEITDPARAGTYLVVVANHYLSVYGSDFSLYYPERKDGDYNGNVGLYVVGIGCRIADGSVINPGDTLVEAHAAVESPAPSTPPVSTACTNSPAPRLTIGLQGRVTPGDANNLRTEPGGTTILGQIAAGEEFTVLDGPVCGANGLTFWQIEYTDLVGWTAEGSGAEYWLEPVQTGRG